MWASQTRPQHALPPLLLSVDSPIDHEADELHAPMARAGSRCRDLESHATNFADQQLIFLRLKLKLPLTASAVAPSTTAIALANFGCLTAEGAYLRCFPGRGPAVLDDGEGVSPG